MDSVDLSDPHLRYFIFAKKISRKSDYKIKVGCCVVRKGTPVGVGYNRVRHSKEWGSKWRTTIHAECCALKNVGNKAYNSIVYVYREKGDGRIGMSRPCPECMERLIEMGVKAVYYTIEQYPFWAMERI